jgi:hypothetical protein
MFGQNLVSIFFAMQDFLCQSFGRIEIIFHGSATIYQLSQRINLPPTAYITRAQQPNINKSCKSTHFT